MKRTRSKPRDGLQAFAMEECPTLDLNAVPLLAGAALDVLAVERELGDLPHLDGDRRHETNDTARTFRDARQVKTAVEAIERLPGPAEAFHLAISGRFALFDVIPAALELAGAGSRIDRLTVATLGFSKANVAGMAALLDEGRVRGLTLLCSHYFKGTSQEIYEYAAAELPRRGQRFLSIRNHAKLLAMQFHDGRTVTVESSANLRSSKNIETMTLCGDPGLYRFHAGWVEELTTSER